MLPRCRISGRSSDCAPALAHDSASQTAASSDQGLLLLTPRLQVALDGPDRLLWQDLFIGRHIDGAVAHLAPLHRLDKVLVGLGIDLEQAQVRRNAAGDGLQAVTARAVLVVRRAAHADCLLVAAIRILAAHLLAERRQFAGVYGLR